MKQNRSPALLYLGGKYLLSEWIISQFPPHKLYVEPYSGAASILFEKPPSRMEIINDLNREIVNFFCVLRDQPEALYHKLLLTPFSRDEYDRAYKEPPTDPVEWARITAVKSWFGVGSNATCERSAFRSYAKGYTFTPSSYQNFLQNVKSLASRLARVIVENRPALELIDDHDGEDTLFYLDPPYLPSTRTSTKRYAFEMRIEDHEALLLKVLSLEGMVILSGYDNELYNDLLGQGFKRIEKSARTFGQKERIEVLWISENCLVPDLFGTSYTEGGI